MSSKYVISNGTKLESKNQLALRCQPDRLVSQNHTYEWHVQKNSSQAGRGQLPMQMSVSGLREQVLTCCGSSTYKEATRQ